MRRGRLLPLTLLALLVTACDRPVDRGPARPPTPELEVMTFNIRFDNPADGANAWPHRRGMVADLLRASGADVVGLQEARRNQLDDLAADLGKTAGFAELGVGRDDGKTGGEFSPILYRSARLEVLGGGTFWLSPTPAHPGSTGWGNHVPRICTWAHFEHRASGRTFYVYNTHLDHESAPARRHAAELIARTIRMRRDADPVIVMGDLNAPEGDPVLATFVDAGLVESFRARHPDARDAGTFNGWGADTTGKKIDFVFAGPAAAVEVLGADIDRARPGGRFPSDHDPVTARLRLLAPTP